MSETKTKNLCTVPAADLRDSQFFIAEDGGELKRIPKAQVVLKKLEKMLATDTENLAGGGEVTAQELLDALAEQVANKLLAKSQVVNNLLATVEGNPLDATQGKALKDLIDTTNNNLSNQTDRVTQLYSDKADKSEFTWKTLGTVSNNEVLNISNITKTANEICLVVYFLIDKNERDYFYIIPVAGLGDGGSVITIGGYYAAAGDYGVVQVNASTSGIGLVTVYHGGQDVRSKASLKVRYR